MNNDPLKRFRIELERYEVAITELADGKKQSQWMWYIFPQIRGIGKSQTSIFYAIDSIDEAERYLYNQELCTRLGRCISATLCSSHKSAEEIFGSELDAQRFHACLTLFNQAALVVHSWYTIGVIDEALRVFFKCELHEPTIDILENMDG